MEKHTLAVLTEINNQSKSGEYVILEKSDFDAVADVSGKELSEIIKGLVNLGYIKLKYQDEDSYCVASLPKGVLVAESEARAKKFGKAAAEVDPTALNVTIDYKKIFKIGFSAALLGSLIPIAISTIVLIIVFVLR